jgi:hypothetical protein
MAKVVEVQARHADRFRRLWPGRRFVEVPPAYRAALRARKMSAPGSSFVKIDMCSWSAGMIPAGMPTTRRPAFDFGGPSSISPVGRSM